MTWASQYLRLRFAMGGRSRPAVDCFGLYRMIVGEQRGVWLDEFGDVSDFAGAARKIAAEQAGQGWQEIARGNEQEFDLVMMRGLVGRGRGTIAAPLHVGCVVSPGVMIDIEETSGVMVRAFRGASASVALANRVTGIFRAKALV